MALRKDGSGPIEQEFPKPELVVASRAGDVLIKNTLLKADHFPGCQNTKLTPLLDGAPNFRQVAGLPVYGTAIPTVRGLRNVLDELGAANGQRRVLWHNMREEPVLYINGKPYVVREADQPFCNVEYTGIDRARVEEMEVRLKADVLREAGRYERHILVTEEDDDMNVIDVWEPVTESDVQTPLEVYAELVEDGYDVDYTRVPITDEKAPKDSDFELLIARLWDVPRHAALVFNCQMGRGRTTTGMVIATLVVLKRLGAFPATHSSGTSAGGAAPLANGHAAPGDQPPHQLALANGAAAPAGAGPPGVPDWFGPLTRAGRRSSSGGGALTPRAGGAEAGLRGGMFSVVRSLLRVLERGGVGKAILDAAIDACAAMQNLREAITTYRSRLMAESKESRRATLMAVCTQYLERYAMLIAFASYLSWSGPFDPTSSRHVSFTAWMERRPELRSVLSRMLRRNPLAALELHIPAATLSGGLAGGRSSDAGDEDEAALSQAEARADGIIESRGGAVLGPLTILKEDYFPGMKSSRLAQGLPGAGNFRRMAGPPVYGVAMATEAGIRNVLDEVLRQQPAGAGHKPVLWFNMREEPVVYINGLPFVLREQARPLKNLQEYAGIEADRLERMEARLKADVLAEAEQHGGRILVVRESAAAPGKARLAAALPDDQPVDNPTGELIDMWEPIPGSHAVRTPAEVYADLAGAGLPVAYLRVPVTDGKAPQAVDVDAIMGQVAAHGYDSPMVFNCQMGAGRTTTGTVIGGLLALYGSGDPAAAFAAHAPPASAGGASGTAAGPPSAAQLALTPPPPIATGRRGGAGTAASASAAPAATAAAAPAALGDGDAGAGGGVPGLEGLNEHQSRDILREEMAGDSPRNSDDEADERLPPALLGAASATPQPAGAQAAAAPQAATPGAVAAPPAGAVTPGAATPAAAGGGGGGSSTGGDLRGLLSSMPSSTSLSALWGELSPEEVQERISLAGGGYVGVRRVVRLLEHGDLAKRRVDTAIDANAAMLNLRVSIMRYRKPKHSYANHKSEVSARHSSFTRGCAYLERYCVLLAFGAFLEQVAAQPGGLAGWSATRGPTFDAWLAARPELQQALGSIHTNPAAALAPVPVSALPVLYRSLRGAEQVSAAEQEEVLRKRRGRTLNRRIILKSYLARAPEPGVPPGTPDVRQAVGLPVLTVGNVSVAALARLLEALGAGSSGSCHVVVTDVREELVMYVNGLPYFRRELEMPAAALHHAGVHPRQLEALEAALKEDVRKEAVKWGGRVLLHQEVGLPAGAGRSASVGGLGASTPAPGGPLGRTASISSQLPAPLAAGSFLTPPDGPLAPAAAQLAGVMASPAAAAAAIAASRAQQVSPLPGAAGAAGATPGGGRPSGSQILVGAAAAAEAARAPGDAGAGDCITAPVDVRPGAAVVPFWEPLDLAALACDASAPRVRVSDENNDASAPPALAPGTDADAPAGEPGARACAGASPSAPPLATALEVAKVLQARGLHITYRRIPLSRERTPVPGDLGDMLKQCLALPAGVGPLDTAAPGGGASASAAAMMREAAASAPAWGSLPWTEPPLAAAAAAAAQHADGRRSIVHLVVSRTATGSSSRFAAAALATFLQEHSELESRAAARGAPASPTLPPRPGQAAPAPAGAASNNNAAAAAAAAGPPASPSVAPPPASGGPVAGVGSPKSPPPKRLRRSASELGEYRGVMSLVRLLPGGLEVKAAVDDAIDRCAAIGNLRQDIAACKHASEAGGAGSSNDPGSTAWAARQLGVHYLKRYFLLICMRCYLVQRQRSEALMRPVPSFSKWVEDRRELIHLLNHLTLV